MYQENMEAALHSMWSELKETIKHHVEDVLSCVDQKRRPSARDSQRRLMRYRWTYRQ
jgi:hypothetical protein